MSAARVLVIGDVMLDVVTRPLDPVALTSDTRASTRVGRGGSGTNLAISMARHGSDVTYCGAVGRDAAGTLVTDDLEREGVALFLEQFDGPTGVVVAVVWADGQRSMITDRGVNPRLSLAHVTSVLEQPFVHLHVSGYTILDDATRDVAIVALALAKDRGLSTSVDVCSVAPLLTMGPEVFRAAVSSATSLLANEEEALALTGCDALERALDELASSFDEVVVTRGPRGAVARRAGRHWEAEAPSVEVIDTTGAGDAATGAYLAASLRGVEPDTALAEAMAASAAVVAGLGSLGQSRL